MNPFIPYIDLYIYTFMLVVFFFFNLSFPSVWLVICRTLATDYQHMPHHATLQPPIYRNKVEPQQKSRVCNTHTQLITCVTVMLLWAIICLSATRAALVNSSPQNLPNLPHPISQSLAHGLYIPTQVCMKKLDPPQFSPSNDDLPTMFPLSLTNDLEKGNMDIFRKHLKTTNRNAPLASTTSSSGFIVYKAMRIATNHHFKTSHSLQGMSEDQIFGPKISFFSTFILWLS